ncbi:MAG: DEAD/DEAH box helicase family protein [Butyrivibrio sp.]|nr:DEAD/DEAH box helicase family protein [Butyrivibrio sp.]
MRVFAEDQYNELTEHIKQLEAENQYLKKLLDDAGIPYDKPDNNSEKDEPSVVSIKEEPITKELVQFYYSMFKGRRDVYSLRSGKPNAKTGKHGYYTQCDNFWKAGLCGKKDGKNTKCQSCPNQKYKPLTGDVIYAHLTGVKEDCSDVVGLYPVWPDETCNYLVFDFDNHDESSNSVKWQEEANALRAICADNDVPCLVERSRSGKGAHVWMFFEKAINIKKARLFGAALLDKGAESVNQQSFDTYDRMIPAQDKLPEGGLGNLVALPLQGRAVKNGNSVFVDEKWQPYHDQWSVLKNTGKLSETFIDEKLSSWGNKYSISSNTDNEIPGQISIDETPWENSIKFERSDTKGTVRIVLADKAYVDKTDIKPRLQNKIRRLAAYNNPEYFKNQGMGISTFGIPRIVYSGEDTEQFIAIPRGCLNKLCKNLKSSNIDYSVEDKRNTGKEINVSFAGELYPEQQDAVNSLTGHDFGVLAAATGFGKTVVGSYLISERKVNTLILVHNNEIMQNWINDLERFLVIKEDYPQYMTKTGRVKTRKSLIGRLTGAHNSMTGIIDVAMVTSLGSGDSIKPFVKDYGMVIMDECHHGAAESIEAVLSKVNAKYVYGLTATVKREDGKDKTVLMQFGPVRFRFTAKDKIRLQGMEHILEPRFTPIISTKEKLTLNEAYEIVVNSDFRNSLIASDIEACIKQGHTPLVLSKRKAQIDVLFEKVKDKADHVLVLTGGKKQSERKELRERLGSISESESLIVLATGQYIGEGFNCSRLDMLFLAMPIAWDGNVEQYTGRLNRSHDGKNRVTVIDYVDHHIEMFANMYNKRLRTYKRIGYELSQDVERKHDDRFIYDSETYSEVFRGDIINAKAEVMISSPYVSTPGSERLIHIFSAMKSKDASISLITYPASHYSDDIKDRIENIHNRLNMAGIKVSFVDYIPSRYAVIDKEILWYGSMNLVSNIKEDDDEMRIVSRSVAKALIEEHTTE